MMDKPVFVDNHYDGNRRLILKLLAVSEIEFQLLVFLLSFLFQYFKCFLPFLSLFLPFFFNSVEYFNFVQYPKQVDITPEQIQQNIEFSKLYKKNFEEEMRKMKAEQDAEMARLSSSKGESSA